MQLAHAGNNSLVGLRISFNFESRIFVRQFLERQAHLLLVSLSFGFNSHLHHRLRNLNAFKNYRVIFIAQSIAGFGILKTDESGNFSSIDFLHLLAMISVQTDDAADALFLVAGSIVNIRTSG